MKSIRNKKRTIIFLITIISSIHGFTQKTGIFITNNNETDSLSLKSVIDSVFKNNPTINQYIENINGANAKIDLAKTGYLPNIEGVALYSKMSPNPQIDLPFGSFQLYPDNSMDAHISINQPIYDFGKTKSNISMQKTSKEISEISIDQAKQKLSLVSSVYFYSLIFLQHAEIIKQEQLNTLNKHLAYIEKKYETGSATKYEIVSTKVKISTIENQLTEIKKNKELQVIRLNLMMGKPGYVFSAKDEMLFNFNILSIDSLYKIALDNRNEINIAKKKETLIQNNIDYVKAQNRPMFGISGNVGFKNGYLPEIEQLKPNYFVGLGFRIPIFDANRTRTMIKIQHSNLESTKFETESTTRIIMDEVSENYSNLLVSQKKMEQYELQTEQAIEAYQLAETSFQLGTITNLDLLDAASNLSESRLLLLKAKIDEKLSSIKLELSIGQKIY
jgi:outer membrane protein